MPRARPRGKAREQGGAGGLEEGAEESLFDEGGLAIVIHMNPDTYQAGAGIRIACGVITLRQ